MGCDANCGGMLTLSTTRIDEVWAEIAEATADVEAVTADLPAEQVPGKWWPLARAHAVSSECPAGTSTRTGPGALRRENRLRGLNTMAYRATAYGGVTGPRFESESVSRGNGWSRIN
jgi:hypothetical protein